jgi:hypothetical protein
MIFTLYDPMFLREEYPHTRTTSPGLAYKPDNWKLDWYHSDLVWILRSTQHIRISKHEARHLPQEV